MESAKKATVDERTWLPIVTAPFDKDLELAVVEDAVTYALEFPCRRRARGWVRAANGKYLDVQPTHWREWQDEA